MNIPSIITLCIIGVMIIIALISIFKNKGCKCSCAQNCPMCCKNKNESLK